MIGTEIYRFTGQTDTASDMRLTPLVYIYIYIYIYIYTHTLELKGVWESIWKFQRKAAWPATLQRIGLMSLECNPQFLV